MELLLNRGMEAIMAINKNQSQVILGERQSQRVVWEALLAGDSYGKTIIECAANRNIFSQSGLADSLFFLRQGKVKVAITSQEGKEAIVAILGAGEFLGEGCLAGQALRVATATAVTDCTLIRIEKSQMSRMMHERHEVLELFAAHLLTRNLRFEEELVDHLFNSCEKRLARILLMLAHFGKESKSEPVQPRVNQEDLARMVGTTRSRVSAFMNKFRTMGFVDYSDGGGLTVKRGLLGVVPHDLPSANWGA
jgi:CRP/FNR family transcriptional regulator, cyclic AMP receptor protein